MVVSNTMFWNRNKNIRVAVGMSGGVDSSVAAAILKRQGYDVVGIFMKYWNEDVTSGGVGSAPNKCCSVDAFEDGRRVSDAIGVPIYTFNFKEPFKEAIVQNFIDEYRAGNTPNPCVRCNELIKFGLFVDKAQELGCDFVATGHYARVKKDWRGRVHLYMGKDTKKDQSYFLHRLKQDVLSRCIFPLGHMHKPQVRALAKRWGITTFNKPESQEICFVGDKKHYGFLSRHIEKSPGPIITSVGVVVGEHEGLAFYTIGQRNRLNLVGGPWYVVGMHHDNNTLIVSDNPEHPALFHDHMKLRDVSWIGSAPQKPFKATVKIRYGHPGMSAHLTPMGSNVQVTFSEKQRAITPGQSAVIYRGNEVLGGGIITRELI